MELFKLLGTIAIDNTKANQALDETTKKAGKSNTTIGDTFKKIGAGALKIAKSVATAGGALGGAWIAAIEGSREYRTEMGKLDTAFVTNGHSSEAAKKTYQELQAVLGDTDVSVEAANHLAVMTDNEKDLQTWTDICTGVFATFGDSLPIEGLTEAANETAKVGQVTGPLADALNWAGISEDEFNDKLAKCSSEQERQRLIMETLNSTYKSASDQYKETNKDVIAANRAQEKLNGAMAELGRVGEPILTAVKNKVAEMVTAAVPHLESFIQKVKDMRKWMKENKTTIDIMAAAVIAATISIAGFVAVMKFSAAMKTAATAIKLVTAAMKALNVAMFGSIGNTLLGGGEAGKEAIAPIDTLQAYIQAAVNAKDASIIDALMEQNRILMDFLARRMPRAVQLDSGALVGELTPAIDAQLSGRLEHTKRGNTR